ncbi:MAG: pyridoxamine 5'-phosphate oxidase [Moheibacter sp.]
MKQDLSNKRKEYSQSFIDFKSIPATPVEMFQNWYESAQNAEFIQESYAMSLATIGTDGYPRTRIVLLKEFNTDGLVFYTNYESDKGKSMAENPHVCLSFFWDKLEQQIIIKGKAEKVPVKMSEDYFHKRPIGSQIGAVLSAQSTVIPFDENLDKKAEELEQKYECKIIPKPENWGGYIVHPVEVEFWQGRPSRLHDRLRYRLANGEWIAERLSP